MQDKTKIKLQQFWILIWNSLQAKCLVRCLSWKVWLNRHLKIGLLPIILTTSNIFWQPLPFRGVWLVGELGLFSSCFGLTAFALSRWLVWELDLFFNKPNSQTNQTPRKGKDRQKILDVVKMIRRRPIFKWRQAGLFKKY